jgi:hypothetical protein
MTLSRNQKYELQKRDSGLTKITIWVPQSSASDFKIMAQFCSENPEHIPFMCRNTQTGKLKKPE